MALANRPDPIVSMMAIGTILPLSCATSDMQPHFVLVQLRRTLQVRRNSKPFSVFIRVYPRPELDAAEAR